MREVRIYVEGGGDSADQAAPLRQALSAWIARALPGSRRPRIIAGGDRRMTYERFCQSLRQQPQVLHLLLVDAEERIDPRKSRWDHVRDREGDGWQRPEGATEQHLHFMAVTMETWLVADADALARYFGQGFLARHLPQAPDLEQVDKANINQSLKSATRAARRGGYDKGRDLGLLGQTSPAVVMARCRHAGIFVEALRAAL